MDLSAFYTRRPEILRRAYSVVREYLRTADGESAVNYMDYGVPLGRRFRALKLWFVMRSYGHEGAAEIIRRHIGWAKELATVIAADARFEMIAPVRMSLVCFRYRGSDEENKRLLDAVNASGRAFLSHTAIDGRIVLRLAIGNMKTTREDVMATWDLLRRTATAPDSAR
jgi:aromatic-L-amino-acid decarboxylase